MNLVIAELGLSHDRAGFDCGEPALNQFLQRFARQQSARDFSKTYVACAPNAPQILGFYSLSAGSVAFAHWDAKLHLPRYPVPVARLGRLAVAKSQQGQGIGAALLSHAVRLAVLLSGQIGLYAVVVDAKDDKAAGFYAQHGFVRFPDQPMTLFLTLNLARQALSAIPKAAR